MTLFFQSFRFFVGFIAAGVLAVGFSSKLEAQNVGRAFHLDMFEIPDEYKIHFEEVVEEFNALFQDYSNELPPTLLRELDQIYLIARFQDLGNGGLLGFAGPDITVTFSSGAGPTLRSVTVPVVGTLVINSNGIDQTIIDGLLKPIIRHELLHAFGFGSLWRENNLLSQYDDFGTIFQYTGGKYALREFRKESGNPFAPFVPVQNFGGQGSALAHWDDFHPFFDDTFEPKFRKELMGSFACSGHPNDETYIVCAGEYFISRTTEGALADLGWAMFNINPNTTPRVRSGSYKNWPVAAREGNNPFGFESGLSLRLVNNMKVFKKNKNITNGINSGGNAKDPNDPFRLKDQKWAK